METLKGMTKTVPKDNDHDFNPEPDDEKVSTNEVEDESSKKMGER